MECGFYAINGYHCFNNGHCIVCKEKNNLGELLREDKSEKPDFTYIAEMYPTFARIMKQLMVGEEKYARLNWRNCEDPLTYKQSAIRHMMQYMDGQDDEDHLIASVVNMLILADLEQHGVR